MNLKPGNPKLQHFGAYSYSNFGNFDGGVAVISR
jgi:hypothetical protein